jgi:hypothetical protein
MQRTKTPIDTLSESRSTFPRSQDLTLVQRKYNQRLNAEKAAEKRARVEKAWKEIDENS